jgi:hypothetical protein
MTSDDKMHETYSTDEGNEKSVPNIRRKLDVKPALRISRRSDHKTINKPISSQSVGFGRTAGLFQRGPEFYSKSPHNSQNVAENLASLLLLCHIIIIIIIIRYKPLCRVFTITQLQQVIFLGRTSILLQLFCRYNSRQMQCYFPH